MQGTTHKKTKIFLWVVLLLLVVVTLKSSVLLVEQNQYINRIDNILNAKSKSIFAALKNKKGPATVKDIVLIQSWMTFDYMNHLFLLPTDYFKNTLMITDTRYPRLSVMEYAENQKVKSSQIVTEVQTAVQLYFLKNNE